MVGSQICIGRSNTNTGLTPMSPLCVVSAFLLAFQFLVILVIGEVLRVGLVVKEEVEAEEEEGWRGRT